MGAGCFCINRFSDSALAIGPSKRLESDFRKQAPAFRAHCKFSVMVLACSQPLNPIFPALCISKQCICIRFRTCNTLGCHISFLGPWRNARVISSLSRRCKIPASNLRACHGPMEKKTNRWLLLNRGLNRGNSTSIALPFFRPRFRRR